MSESKVIKSVLSFPVTFEKIDEINSSDTRFTRLKCWLMHTNENYNQSSFSRKVIEDALPTLAYIPVVGFIEDNELGEKDFSDHRYIITKDDGKIRRKYMGSAYGVVLSSKDNNAHFETKICSDGIEREFVVADAIMWNFLEDSCKIMNRDLIKDHSIELDENSIEGYEDEETGIFHFTKFSFRAACILGGDAQPAMEGSTVEVVKFTMSDFVKSIQSELNNKYSAFTKLVNDTTLIDSISDNTFVESQITKEKNNEGGYKAMPNNDFTQTAIEQFTDISNIVAQYEVMEDRWGDNVSRFYLQDIQDNEVIVVDRKNNYQYYGFPFVMNGDKAEIDFACGGKRKKVRYENYEEGTTVQQNGFNFGKHIDDIENNAFAKIEEANAKVLDAENKISEFETNYNNIKADYDEMKPKYDDYVRAEQLRISAELDAQKDAEFAKYETVLSDDVNFEALKEKKAEMTVKEIESECAILYARKNLAQINFSKSNNSYMTAGLINNDEKDGFVETKYGNIPVRR